MNTLANAKTGSTVTVLKVTGERPIKRRMLELGLLPETEIFIRKVAPLGDPIEITVLGAELTLRKNDAKNVYIKE